VTLLKDDELSLAIAENVIQPEMTRDKLLRWRRALPRKVRPVPSPGATTKDAAIASLPTASTEVTPESVASALSPPKIQDDLEVQHEVAPFAPEGSQRKESTTASSPKDSDDRSPDVMHEVSVEDMVPAVEAERLRAELAAATERLRHVKHELETARAIASRPPAVDASMKAPTTDEEIPPFLNRYPLSPEDQLAFDAVMTAWANSTTRAALLQASPVVQERFSTVLRADVASSSSRSN
jgi:hypothetical protein